jgi:exonuclease III
LILEKSIDLFFLQETWLHSEEGATIREVIPPGYSFLNFPRGQNQGWGGTGILYRTVLNLTIVPLDVHTHTFEKACVVDTHTGIMFINIYRPFPSPTNKFRTCDFFERF